MKWHKPCCSPKTNRRRQKERVLNKPMRRKLNNIKALLMILFDYLYVLSINLI